MSQVSAKAVHSRCKTMFNIQLFRQLVRINLLMESLILAQDERLRRA